MRKLVPLTAALLVAAFVGLLVSSSADAHGRRGHGSHVHFGFAFGVPGPFFYPAPVFAPFPQPVFVSPPQYIEQNPPAPQPAPPASSVPSQGGSGYNWYFCPDSQTYYPYVQTCASQWQQVVPGPAPPS